MKGKKTKDSDIGDIICDVQIIDRSIQHAAGLDIPDDFGLKEILSIVKVDEKPQYVLWNDGKPVASETGGTDCIAYLCLKENKIVGWSI